MAFDEFLHARQVLGSRYPRDQDLGQQRGRVVEVERFVAIRQHREGIERLVREWSIRRVPPLERVRARSGCECERTQSEQA